MAKADIPLGQAEKIANKIKAAIGEYCERIAVAGSIRRKCEIVGDIEIVAQPKVVPEYDLFENWIGERPQVREISRILVDMGLEKVKGGEKYQKRHIPYEVSGIPDEEMDFTNLHLDLFLVTPPATWAVIFMQRTGPWQFSKKMVTKKSHGGFMPGEYRIKDGRVVDTFETDEINQPKTERGLFEMWDMGYLEPWERE